MEENMEAISHDVTITSRKKLVMSGIKDVSSFDEMQIIARSNDADISIEGENLKIEKFDSEGGDLIVNGKINGINYYNVTNSKKKKSIMNIFK